MIKLTGKSGIAIYVNPDKIIGVNAYGTNEDEGSFINYGNDQYIVSQSPEEVVRKIMEYKLAIVRYTTSSQIAYDCYSKNKQNPYTPPLDQVLILDKLAGLEQTP